MFAALSGLMVFALALLPTPVQAQAIVVNGVSCPTASVQLSAAGLIATLPVGCSGNGNACDSALVSFTVSGIFISAPPACLTASVIASPIPLQSANVNGNTCPSATVTFSSGRIAFNTAACLAAIPPPPPISVLAVKSRKVHGAAGSFDIAIDTTQAINGLVTVEPRAVGTGHVVVFQFDAAVTTPGSATVVDSLGATLSASLQQSGNDIAVTLLNATDISRVRVSLTGVNGSVNASASLGFLLGDVNNSRTVSSSDISGVKARSGQVTDASNFKFDVNTSGAINASDISTFKARSGNTLP